MENNNDGMLIVLEKSSTVNALIKFFKNLNLDPKTLPLTLTSVFKESTGEKSLMDSLMEDDTKAENTMDDIHKLLGKAKKELLKYGFTEQQIKTDILKGKNATSLIAGKIKKDNYSMVLLGRKYNMSKSEEFALGEISSRLLREPIKTTIIVLKTNAL